MTDLETISTLSPEQRRALLKDALRKKAVTPDTRPLSQGQRALWFVHQVAPESAAYVAPLSMRIRSELDVRALRRALELLLRRHAALRTTFSIRDGDPIALVHPEPAVDFEVIDGRAWTEAAALEHLAAEAERPFDLERGPLLRLRLIQRAPREHLLLLTAHHIVIDLWSLVVLVDDLGALYAAESGGASPPPEPLGRWSFFEFVREEAEFLAGPQHSPLADYWRQQLAGDLPALELPADRPRPRVLTFRGASCPVRVPPGLTAALRALAKAEETTLNTVLLAAFFVLLQRSSNQDQVIVGTPTSGRHRPEYAQTIGYFVNPIALRADLAGNPGFRTFLQQVRSTVLEGMKHERYPFPRVVQDLQPDRDTGRSPIFQSLFVLQQVQQLDDTFAVLTGIEGAKASLGPLACEPLRLPRRSAQFDLELMLMEYGGMLRGSFQYASDLFDEATMARMARRFELLLEGIAQAPDTPVLRLPFLDAQERQQLLVEFNDTAAEFPADVALHQLVERQVDRTPEAVAVVLENARVSYAELELRANQLAHVLLEQGLTAETPVGVCLPRSVEMVAAVLAVLKAGGAFVPLDPAYPPERLTYMLDHAQARFVIAPPSMRALGSETRKLIEPELVLRGGGPASRPQRSCKPRQLAYIIYTSGSTGRPKGVAIEHRSAVNTLWDMNRRCSVGSSDRTLMLSSLSFDLSIYDIFGVLAAGGAVVLPDDSRAREPACWWELARREQVTIWNTVPALMDMLVSYCADRPGLFPTSLRWVWLSGDFIPLALPDGIRALSPATKVLSLGGATEGSVWSINYPIGRVDPSWESIPYGAPLANQSYYVLNEALEPCPIGVAGMLYIGGIGVARGYWNDEEKTSAAFLLHPHSQERIYRTGDLGRFRDAHNIEILGRADTQVKIRGFRIELGEVEAVLSRHPGLSGALVVVHASAAARRAQREHTMVAYIKAPEQGAPSAEELRAWLRQRLPEYMLPASFVRLDSFPLSANGKVDRKALPRPQEARVAAVTYEAPRGSTEQLLAAIWADLLGNERVSVDENFFDLGGHSMLMARAQSRIRKELGRELRIVELFAHPTIRTLARHLDGSGGAAAAGDAALEEFQQRVRARSSRRGAEQPVAVIGYAGRFPGAADVAELWKNLSEGRDGIRFFSEQELADAGVPQEQLSSAQYVKAAGFLAGADSFDPGYFGYSARDAATMDPQHGALLECADAALSHAGYDPWSYAGRIGVYAGAGMPSYYLADVAQGRVTDMLGLVLGNDKDFLTTRISYKLNLRGPSVAVQTACSTSLVAVHLACRALQEGACEIALAGGVSLKFPQIEGYLYQEGSIASPDGHCRAFDARARGTVPGDGVGLVVLKRLDDALADRDTIHAVIRGSAINNDGAQKVSYTAPSVEHQAEVVAEALAVAGVDAASIQYIEAHGTGTELGDPIEISALSKAFGASGAKPQSVAIGSIKTNIGHLNAAAGVAGLIKAVAALEHGQIPPSLNFETPNPAIELASSPFYVNTRLAAWPAAPAGQRRAGVSSFGIGGTNAHVVLEEAPAQQPAESSRAWQLVTLSARTPPALERASAQLAAHLQAHPELSLADVAYTGHVGRRAFGERRAIVARSTADAAAALADANSPQLLTGSAEARPPQVAFLFPGQGSQYVNMAAGLYGSEPTLRSWIERGSELLRPLLGLDLRKVIYPGASAGNDPAGAAALANTALAQPALFVTSYALAQLWLEWGVQPSALLGHSVGEYVAACLAGVFPFEAGLRLIAARGRLISALPSGAMLMVSLPESELAGRLGDCEIAAVNAPSSCVVSGPTEAVAALRDQLTRQGVSVRALHTSHAFHSSMMEPALQAFGEVVAGLQLRAPQLPFVSNVTGTWITPQQAADPRYWVRHLRQSVRFSEGLDALLAPERNIGVLLEVGPGHTLTSLARPPARPSGARLALSSLPAGGDVRDDAEQAVRVLGRLWLAGVDVAWGGVHRHEHRRRVPLPSYPLERQVVWPAIESLAGKRERAPEMAAALVKNPEIGGWFYVPTWTRSLPSGGEPSLRAPARWLLLEDEVGLAPLIAERLVSAGNAVQRVRWAAGCGRDELGAYTLRPGVEQDYVQLFQQLLAEGAPPEAILDLSLLSSKGAPEPERLAEVDAGLLPYRHTLCLARAIARAELPVRLTVVSNGVHAVTGEESLSPLRSAMLGPLTVLGQEHPQVSSRHLDVILPASSGRLAVLAEDVLAEAQRERGDARVALRGRQRWTQTFAPLVAKRAEAGLGLLREGGVYLITGGLGNVGLTLAGALARTARAKLVLLGRSADENTALAAVRELEAAGAEVLIARADVADVSALSKVIERTKARFGALHGVIHAAGITELDPTATTIAELSEAASDRQFHGKVRGVLALEQTLQGEQIDFVLLTSSLSTSLGGYGFAAYAGANLFLDAFAEERAARQGAHDPSWLCVNWDAWATQAEADALASGSELAQLAIRPEEGAEAFLRALAQPAQPRLLISTGNLPARVAKWVNTVPGRSSSKSTTESGQRLPRPNLANPFVAPGNDVEQQIADIWQELLGFERIGVHDDFIELGGHSLLATQVVSRLRKAFKVELPIRSFIEAPTIAGLALVILQQQAALVPQNTLDQLLAELGSLGEEEVQERLGAPVVATEWSVS